MKSLTLILSILILLAGNAWAQQSGNESRLLIAFREQLLDSAYKYELLKPTFYHLRSAYESRGKEIEDLRNALRMSELQTAMQKQGYEAIISEERKSAGKGYWKGFKHGFGSGFLTGFLTGLSVH
jgi:hypothetical protein